jgi:hypothetical protein
MTEELYEVEAILDTKTVKVKYILKISEADNIYHIIAFWENTSIFPG